ncbi:hypothetical protein ABH944_005940 [Caballeronia udeis]|uniref:Uncharacterized protein n=1 Tax=Caballeronia udeis TaxID=1232866 RepID=A0ABW8MPX8_9BURK
MRTIVRIIPLAVEQYFWNLVRIRNSTQAPDSGTGFAARLSVDASRYQA